jgi:hypothetical protein
MALKDIPFRAWSFVVHSSAASESWGILAKICSLVRRVEQSVLEGAIPQQLAGQSKESYKPEESSVTLKKIVCLK